MERVDTAKKQFVRSSSGVRPGGPFLDELSRLCQIWNVLSQFVPFRLLKQELHKCRPASPKAFKESFATVNGKKSTQHAEINEAMIRFNTSSVKHNKT